MPLNMQTLSDNFWVAIANVDLSKSLLEPPFYDVKCIGICSAFKGNPKGVKSFFD
jgi:hypothetical protein